jgi:hypothetical protein
VEEVEEVEEEEEEAAAAVVEIMICLFSERNSFAFLISFTFPYINQG